MLINHTKKFLLHLADQTSQRANLSSGEERGSSSTGKGVITNSVLCRQSTTQGFALVLPKM